MSFLVSNNTLQLKDIINSIKTNNFKEADDKLNLLIQKISYHLANTEWIILPDTIEEDYYLMAAEDIPY